MAESEKLGQTKYILRDYFFSVAFLTFLACFSMVSLLSRDLTPFTALTTLVAIPFACQVFTVPVRVTTPSVVLTSIFSSLREAVANIFAFTSAVIELS